MNIKIFNTFINAEKFQIFKHFSNITMSKITSFFSLIQAFLRIFRNFNTVYYYYY